MSFKKDLSIAAKGNFKWNGTFEDLKKVINSLGFSNAKWTSPGGDCKLVEGDDASLRWYTTSGTLTIKGEKAFEIESKLRTFINDQTEETVEENIDRLLRDNRSLGSKGDRESSIAESGSDDDHSDYEAEGSPSAFGNKSFLDEVVLSLKSQVDTLTHKISQYEADSEKIAWLNIEVEQLKQKDPCLCHSESVKQLKQKIENLERENEILRDKNVNLTCTLSELNMKMKDTENERMSLLTAIKLLQSDQDTDRKQNLHHSEKCTSQTITPNLNTKTFLNNNTIQLNNKYDVLTVDDTFDEAEQSHLHSTQHSNEPSAVCETSDIPV